MLPKTQEYLVSKVIINNNKTINIFCNLAGSKINVSKTECILLGPLKNCLTNINGIKVTNKTVKCLGIYTYIGHDKIENWMNRNFIRISEKRKLTLFGKCSVINSLA